MLCCWSWEHCIHFCTVAGTTQNTFGYYFSSAAIITEGKKKAQKLVLGPMNGPQRRAEKGQNQASCVMGTSSHGYLQPWVPAALSQAAPLHVPKNCTAFLFRAHICSPLPAFFLIVLKSQRSIPLQMHYFFIFYPTSAITLSLFCPFLAICPASHWYLLPPLSASLPSKCSDIQTS